MWVKYIKKCWAFRITGHVNGLLLKTLVVQDIEVNGSRNFQGEGGGQIEETKGWGVVQCENFGKIAGLFMFHTYSM